MKYPKISIIFTNYNGGENPLNCLDSIKKLNYPQKYLEIIIVDNHSTDGSTNEIEKKFPEAKLLYQTKNLGFAGAINVGIKHASGEYLFITNDDIVFEKDSLKILIEYAKTHPNIGVIGGKQLNYETKKFYTGGRNFNLFIGKPFPVVSETPTECNAIDGCTMLIPKEVISKVGLFDSGFWPVLFEDLDFCWRVRKEGLLIIYHPKAIFLHHYAQSVSKIPCDKLYFINFKNKLRFIIKHANLVQFLSYIFIHYFLIMPTRIIFYREPIFIPEIKAINWNLKNIKKTFSARKKDENSNCQ